MAEPVKIAGVQMDVALSDTETNLQRMEAALKETASWGAALTILPECALTGYCFESLQEAMPFAEPVPGESTERMARVCRRLGVHAVFGMLEVDGERLFNACVLVGGEGVIGGYRKVHLPYLGIDRFATPGDRPLDVHQVGDVRIGMNICYDGSFPEAARVMALDGADLIVLPTNWPPGAQCTADHVINTRALENNVYYIAVNRIGTERGFRFIGRSKICDPSGDLLAEAPHEEAAVLYAEIDVDRARNKRLVRVPGKHQMDRFADRRPEMYDRITAPLEPSGEN